MRCCQLAARGKLHGERLGTGAAGSAIYVYQIPGGELRFAVRTGAPERVLSIAIDRTSLAPRVRVRNRLAKWGKTDLTPFTA